MISAKYMDITPEFAKELLDQNKDNYRAINHKRVEMYSRQMASGLWQENAEPIHVYEDGTLANGQHRLSAVVDSGATIPMLIVYGVKKDVRTFDVGSRRTTAQILKANGVDISPQESSAISILKNGFYGAYGVDEIIDYYGMLKDFDVVSFAVRKGASHPIMNKAGVIAAAYCAYRLGRISLNEIEQFSIICNSGIPSEGFNIYPPLCFRRTLQTGYKTDNGERVIGGMAQRTATFETAFKAFCDFHRGTKRRINYRQDGTGKDILKAARTIYEQYSSTLW